MQRFQHGTIVWFPNLGPAAIFGVYHVGNGNEIGVDWQGMPNEAHWRVGVSTGGAEQFTDFPGGSVGGHSVAGGSTTWVRLVGCTGATDASCGPTMAGGREVAGDGIKQPVIELTSQQNYTVAAPSGGFSTVSIGTAQIRSYFHADSKTPVLGSLAAHSSSFCGHNNCVPSWLPDSVFTFGFFSLPVGIVSVPVAGYVYDTHKGVAGDDGHLNMMYRLGFRFDLSQLTGKRFLGARLVLHGQRTMSNFDNSGILCGTELGMLTSDWWDSPHQNLDQATFANALHSGSSSPSATVDVTSIVKGWLASPSSNYGLVLRNPDENLGAFTELSCLTEYDGISLAVDVAK